jgi:ABC-2 type transport system permease protein
LSREVSDAFTNDPHFKIIPEISSYAQLEEGMKNGTLRAGVVIPEDFAVNVALHRSTEVLTVFDASNLIWGFNIRRYTMEVVNKFSADHAAAYLAGLGLSTREISNTLNTVSCNIEVLYNPTYSYTTFIIMGLFLLIIHQLGLLSVGLTITREKERNTWIQYLAAAVPAWKIFFGKSLPYFLTSIFNYALLIWFAVHLVDIKVEGPASLILALGLVFILIITAVGFYLSVLSANSLQITRLIMLLSVPFFFIAGYTWPKTHIPALVNGLAALLPYNWMAAAMRLVTLKNLGFADVQLHTLVLCAMAAISVLLGATFSKRIKPPEDDGPVVNGGTYTPKK